KTINIPCIIFPNIPCQILLNELPTLASPFPTFSQTPGSFSSFKSALSLV
ncbi:hypothetical protein NDU88_001093, partial [Pleurodeles waltl]